jgi:predicted RNA-binding protein with RPS1 domain
MVTDVVNVGDMVMVMVLSIDDRGMVKLSWRVVDQETGEEIVAPARPPRPLGDGGRDEDRPRGDRPRRQRRAS